MIQVPVVKSFRGALDGKYFTFTLVQRSIGIDFDPFDCEFGESRWYYEMYLFGILTADRIDQHRRSMRISDVTERPELRMSHRAQTGSSPPEFPSISFPPFLLTIMLLLCPSYRALVVAVAIFRLINLGDTSSPHCSLDSCRRRRLALASPSSYDCCRQLEHCLSPGPASTRKLQCYDSQAARSSVCAGANTTVRVSDVILALPTTGTARTRP
ncbi:hypothetical protein BDZ89DRAFT_1189777, partial [Hymenopellis radicata]